MSNQIKKALSRALYEGGPADAKERNAWILTAVCTEYGINAPLPLTLENSRRLLLAMYEKHLPGMPNEVDVHSMPQPMELQQLRGLIRTFHPDPGDAVK